MRRKLYWSHTARRDLVAIVEYIAQDSPAAAARVGERVIEAAYTLSEFSTGRPGRVSGTHEKIVSGLPYILAYEIIVEPGGDEAVAILHVIHGARDWPAETWPPG